MRHYRSRFIDNQFSFVTYTLQAGIIDEMLQDTMESMDDDEIEEEAEEEVNKVLFQITDGNVCRIPLHHFMYNFRALD